MKTLQIKNVGQNNIISDSKIHFLIFHSIVFRESPRTSRSSTSSFKENISDNIPSQSHLIVENSKPILKSLNQENFRSPLSRRSDNIDEHAEIGTSPIKPKHAQPNLIIKKDNSENKKKREELEFIKGKKCVKCGYSSVKVRYVDFLETNKKIGRYIIHVIGLEL